MAHDTISVQLSSIILVKTLSTRDAKVFIRRGYIEYTMRFIEKGYDQ